MTDESQGIQRIILVDYNETLGSGTHGKVNECYINGEKHAIKIIPLHRRIGICNLIECCMINLHHPSINKIFDVMIQENNVFMTQNLAICNLTEYIEENELDMETKKKMLLSLVEGVYFLHQNNIIHADLKSNNILVYKNKETNEIELKIADFGSSVLKIYSEQKYTHSTSTYNFRPPESLIQKEWDHKLDIWSLGCIFFHIYTGKLLFPRQTSDKLDEVIHKKEIKEKSLNCLFDWSLLVDNMNYFTERNISKKEDLLYNHFDKSLINDIKQIMDPEVNSFHELLSFMLIVDPEKRLDINEVRKHPYFDGFEQSTGMIEFISVKPVKIDDKIKLDKLYRLFLLSMEKENTSTEHEVYFDKLVDIFSLISTYENITSEQACVISISIYCKLTSKKSKIWNYHVYCPKLEYEVCTHFSYKFIV